jgi:hypothetical protein
LDDSLAMDVEHGKPGQLVPGQFGRIAKAFSDPRRFAILEQVAAAERDCPYSGLCQRFPVSKATLWHPGRNGCRRGWWSREKDGQYVQNCVRGVRQAPGSHDSGRACGRAASHMHVAAVVGTAQVASAPAGRVIMRAHPGSRTAADLLEFHSSEKSSDA